MLSERDQRALQRENFKLKKELDSVPKLTNNKFDKLKRIVMRHIYRSQGNNHKDYSNYCITDTNVKVYNDINMIIIKMLRDKQLEKVYFQSPWFSNTQVIDELNLFADRGGQVFINTIDPKNEKFKSNYNLLNNIYSNNINVSFTPCNKVYKWDNYTHSKNYLFQYGNGDTISATGSLNSSKSSNYNVEELMFTSDKEVFDADIEKYFL